MKQYFFLTNYNFIQNILLNRKNITKNTTYFAFKNRAIKNSV